jgi:competence protein ComEC
VPILQDLLQQAGREIAPRPLVALAAALALGIVLSDRVALPVWGCVGFTVLLVVMCLLVRNSHCAALSLLLATSGLGALLHSLAMTPLPGDLSRLAGAPLTSLEGTLHQVSYQRGGHAAFLLRATCATDSQGRRLRVSGQAEATVRGRVAMPLRPGQQVRLDSPLLSLPQRATNWGQPDARKTLARRSVFSVVEAATLTALPKEASPAVRLEEHLSGTRQRVMELYRRTLGGSRSSGMADLLVAMVLGDDVADLSDETRELFRRSGTIHLLVVSGAQVSAVVALVVTLAGGSRRLTWWHLLLLGPLILWFGLLTGMGTSIARSLTMCAIWAVCTVTARCYDLVSSIALSAILLMLTHPGVVFEGGAQLTFAATTGVAASVSGHKSRPLHGLGPLERVGVRAVEDVYLAGLATFGTWLMTAPLLCNRFYGFSMVGVVANLVAVPLSALVVILGLAAALLGSLAPALAWPLCALARVLISCICGVNSLCLRLPGAFVDNVYLPPLGCVIWYAALALLFGLWRSGVLKKAWSEHRGTLLSAAALSLALTACVCAISCVWPRPAAVTTFDVGEGQSSLVETPDARTLLVDAGGRFGLTSFQLARDVVRPYLIRRGHRRLDVLVITHSDTDHYSAVTTLARWVPVGVVLVKGDAEERSWRRTLSRLRSGGAIVRVAHAGTRLRLGETALEVLSPPADREAHELPAGDNNASLLVRVQSGGLTALFPGDLETAGMAWALNHLSPSRLRADFLQVPHHGRSSANLPAFWETVQPKVAVVSRRGVPFLRAGADTCAQFARYQLSTEEVGAVRVEQRGRRLLVTTYLPPCRAPKRGL